MFLIHATATKGGEFTTAKINNALNQPHTIPEQMILAAEQI
jgi:hypothetical protein